MIELDCSYDDAPHTFPDDWIFGGADGCHPAADPRFKPTVYRYFDGQYQLIWSTVVPLCDEEAIDQFTFVASISPGFDPVYLAVLRPGAEKQEMLKVRYDKATDTASDLT